MSPVFHFRRNCSLTGRFGVVAVVVTALAVSATPVATAAPKDWTIVAHRGGLVATPEHTKAGFAYMLLRGVDAVEIDVRFTADGKPVAFHDTTLDRTTDCSGLLARITLERLKRCDAGSWFGLRFAGEKVLSVNNAMKYISARSKRVEFFLHMRSTKLRDNRKLMKFVKARGLRNRAVLISGSQAGLATARKAGFRRLGYVFNQPAGWNTRYDYLIPYNVTSNPQVVAAAQARRQRVLPVEDHPHSLGALAGLDIDGVLVNHLDKALILAGRLVTPPEQTFDAPSEPEPTTIPAGEPRTTGPMDF